MSPEMSVTGIQSIQGEKLHQPYSVVIPDATRVDWANTISALTTKAHAKGEMLAKTSGQVLDLFARKHSVVITDQAGNFKSHAGATFEYPDGRIEIGAVCTDEQAQGNGYGRAAVEELLKHLKQMYPDRKIFALANEASEGLFEKVGGEEMSIRELHGDVFEACKDCLRRPKNVGGKPQCCDIPFDLTDALKKPRAEATIFSSKVNANGTNGTGHVKI